MIINLVALVVLTIYMTICVNRAFDPSNDSWWSNVITIFIVFVAGAWNFIQVADNLVKVCQ